MKFERTGAVAIDESYLSADWQYDAAPKTEVPVVNDVALLTVRGPLVHHDEWYWDSYDAILRRAAAAFGMTPKAVLISGSSPGGEVSGCFSGARELRSMADHYGIPLVWYVDGESCSAALAWAMACDYVVLPPEGRFGSIGAVVEVCSYAGVDEKYGIDRRIIASGARKADGNPGQPLTDDSVAAIQASVDFVAEKFFEWVSLRTGVPVETIRSWEAGIFHGQQAIDLGIADALEDDASAINFARNRAETLEKESEGSIMPGAKNRSFASVLASLTAIAAEGGANAERANAALAAVEPKEGAEDSEPKEDAEDSEPDGDEPSEDSAAEEDDTSAEGEEPKDEPDGDEATAASALAKAKASKAAALAGRQKALASADASTARAMSALVSDNPKARAAAQGHLREAQTCRERAEVLRQSAAMQDTLITLCKSQLRVEAAVKGSAKKVAGGRAVAGAAQKFAATHAAAQPRAAGAASSRLRPNETPANASGLAALIPEGMAMRAGLVNPSARTQVGMNDEGLTINVGSPEEARKMLEKLQSDVGALYANGGTR